MHEQFGYIRVVVLRSTAAAAAGVTLYRVQVRKTVGSQIQKNKI